MRRNNEETGGRIMLRRLVACATAVLLTLALAQSTVAGEFSQTYSPGPWISYSLYGAYVDIDVDLGFGVAAVDSVWFEIAGRSFEGWWPAGEVSAPCWDGLMVRFVDEPGTSCPVPFETSWPAPDGIADCNAGFVRPIGSDWQPFHLTGKLTGIEHGSDMDHESFVTVVANPSLGDIFVDGHATLTIEKVSGGCCGLRCHDGLAQLSQITLHVAYNDALPVEGLTWGAMKARFR